MGTALPESNQSRYSVDLTEETKNIVYPLSLVRIALAIRWPVERSVERGASAPTAVPNSIWIVADDQLPAVARSGCMNTEALPLLGEIKLTRAARIQFATADLAVRTADEKVTLATGTLRELAIALLIRFVVDIARNTSARQAVGSVLRLYLLPIIHIHSVNGGSN